MIARWPPPLVAALTVGCLGAAAATMGGGCGQPCRAIQVQPLTVECVADATFDGEIHLDDAAVYQSFLELQCLPGVPATDVAARVAEVDFLTRAVFVAAGARQPEVDVARCIDQRTVDSVAVCDDGLRVAFNDVVSATTPCGGRWTVAFSLDRADLRAAIDEDPGAGF